VIVTLLSGVGVYGFVQSFRQLGAVHVVFTTGAIVEEAEVFEFLQLFGEGFVVECHRFLRDICHRQTADAGGSASKGDIEDFAPDADRFKDLRALVR
jgi:hypothetical protein